MARTMSASSLNGAAFTVSGVGDIGQIDEITNVENTGRF